LDLIRDPLGAYLGHHEHVHLEQRRGLIRAAGPGALALLAISIVARLPQAMFSIALLVHAHRLTGSFAVAGVVSGAYVIATGIGAPLLGRLVDRCGQTVVLLCTALASALLLAVSRRFPTAVRLCCWPCSPAPSAW
jgi:MFS family permease